MPYRKKILIIENDDFLREIVGNLLHKNEYYIINSSSVNEGIEKVHSQQIYTVILGTSCLDYKDKNNIHYIKKNLGEVEIFILNTNKKEILEIDPEQQMKISELSIKEILRKLA